jgi:hypothetical protein
LNAPRRAIEERNFGKLRSFSSQKEVEVDGWGRIRARETYKGTRTYSCREIINTENLDRVIKAKRLDPKQLTQLQRFLKRLKEYDGYAHKVNFALNPQERRGRG